MGYGNISGVLLPADKAEIKKDIDAIKLLLPFLVNLTKADRKRLRTIGSNRVGYVTEVNVTSNAHRPALSQDFDLVEFNKDKALFTDLVEIISWLAPLLEALESTLMALGAEVMKSSDTAYGYLKIHAVKNNDENLLAAIQRIKAILKQTKKDDKLK